MTSDMQAPPVTELKFCVRAVTEAAVAPGSDSP